MRANERIWMSMGALASGAGLMYVLDPARGRRRRARLRDRAVHASHETKEGAATVAADLDHRSRGLAARLRSAGRRRGATAEVLEARVRSALGRLVSHPHAVKTSVRNGRVTLSGDVLSSERGRLLDGVAGVKGVSEVRDELRGHAHAGSVPSLQGGQRRLPRPELLQENWTPAIRFLAGLAGSGLALGGLRMRSRAGWALGILGGGLFARAASNQDVKRMLGLRGRRGVDIDKSIGIEAPVERVYDFFEHPAAFARFMRNVRSVDDLGGGRHRWTVAGPAGVPVKYDAVITRREPPRILAWKTVPGAVVRHAGILRFERKGEQGTRVHVRMSYNPVAGLLGHGIASLFGADPKHEMDEDLLRLKSLLEVGKTRVGGETVTRDQVAPEQGVPE